MLSAYNQHADYGTQYLHATGFDVRVFFALKPLKSDRPFPEGRQPLGRWLSPWTGSPDGRTRGRGPGCLWAAIEPGDVLVSACDSR